MSSSPATTLSSPDPLVVVHHWDTDGVASALILREERGEEPLFFPPSPGRYSLTAPEREELSSLSPREILLADMNLSQEEYLFLQRTAQGNFTAYDHHGGYRAPEGIRLINPLISGGDPGDALSTTAVLRRHFSRSEDLLYWLGVWGDTGFKTPDGSERSIALDRFLESEGRGRSEFLRLVTLLDLPYRTGRREMVLLLMERVRTIDLWELLKEELFVRLEEEIEEALRSAEASLLHEGPFQAVFFSGKPLISSQLCRTLYARDPDRLSLVVHDRGEDLQFYLRTQTGPFPELIGKAKGMGFSAGGKGDVVGAVLKPEEVKSFITLWENLFLKPLGIELPWELKRRIPYL